MKKEQDSRRSVFSSMRIIFFLRVFIPLAAVISVVAFAVYYSYVKETGNVYLRG